MSEDKHVNCPDCGMVLRVAGSAGQGHSLAAKALVWCGVCRRWREAPLHDELADLPQPTWEETRPLTPGDGAWSASLLDVKEE